MSNNTFKNELLEDTEAKNEQIFYLLFAFRFFCCIAIIFTAIYLFLKISLLHLVSGSVFFLMLPGVFKRNIRSFSSFFQYYFFVVIIAAISFVIVLSGGINAPPVPWLAIFTSVSVFVLPRKGSIVIALYSLVFLFALFYNQFYPFLPEPALNPEQISRVRFVSITASIIFSLVVFLKISSHLNKMKNNLLRTSKIKEHILKTFDATDDYIGVARPDGQIVYHNHAFNQIAGKDNKTIASNQIADFHPEWALKVVKEQAIPSALKNGSWTGETAILSATAEEIPVLQTLIVHKDETKGKDIEFISTVMKDIRPLKEKEANLQKAKDIADSSAKEKAQFLANMSHEIRTPMNGVLGMATLLKEEIKDSKALDMVETLLRSGTTLQSILNDILDFSKIEAGKMELESTEFNVRLLLKDIKQIMDAISIEQNLQVHLQINPKFPKWIIGDSTRLKQVLINLVSNAIKFGEQKDVTVYADCKMKPKSKHISLEFAVEDRGIGMDEEEQKKLFTPFIQTDSSTTRKFGGTGLGLSISKAIVEAHQGKIWLDSKAGKGTTFYVSFPTILCETPPKKKFASEKEADFSDLRVLVAEDNSINQQIIAGFLKKLGIHAEVVNNGQEAVDQIKVESFDLILMDCQMPIMDGYEASKRILDHPAKNPPIICALTASAMKEDKERCIRAGMQFFLSKPLSFAELQATLNTIDSLRNSFRQGARRKSTAVK